MDHKPYCRSSEPRRWIPCACDMSHLVKIFEQGLRVLSASFQFPTDKTINRSLTNWVLIWGLLWALFLTETIFSWLVHVHVLSHTIIRILQKYRYNKKQMVQNNKIMTHFKECYIKCTCTRPTLTRHAFKNLQVLVIDSQISWAKMHSLCEYGSRAARYFIATGRRWAWVEARSSSVERSHMTVVTSEGTTLQA